jgi:hypothetical protein
MCLFQDYLSNTMCIGVVMGESAVGVLLRRLFRHEWMHVTGYCMLRAVP